VAYPEFCLSPLGGLTLGGCTTLKAFLNFAEGIESLLKYDLVKTILNGIFENISDVLKYLNVGLKIFITLSRYLSFKCRIGRFKNISVQC